MSESYKNIEVTPGPGRSALGSIALGVEVVSGIESSFALVDQLAAIPGVKLETTELTEVKPVLGDKAVLMTDVDLDGIGHISLARIDEFTEDKAAADTGKKFGRGTYFGVGEVAGEAVESLENVYNSGNAYLHEASLAGNVVVMNRNDVRAIHEELQTVLGENSVQRFGNRSFKTAPVGDLLQRVTFNDQAVDAVVIMMDDEGRGAEVVVLPSATTKIRSRPGHKKGERPSAEVMEQGSSRLKIPAESYKELSEMPGLDPVLAGIARNVANGESPLDTQHVMAIEGMTSRVHISHDIHRLVLVSQLGELMDQPVGVDEGYTLGEHTQMVLSIFESQFAKELFAEDPSKATLVRTALLLQDIGKPLALAVHGDRKSQTDYNHDVAQAYLKDIDMTDQEKTVVTELVGQDILGTYLKEVARDFSGHNRGLGVAASEVKQLASKTGIPAGELIDILHIMYVSDAGAYTSHSKYMDREGRHLRGVPSLDSAFEYDDTSARLNLNPRFTSAFNKLKATIDL